MPSRKKQDHVLTFTDLAKAAHSNDRAWHAVERYNKLLEERKDPEILYSEFNGYRVRDRNAIYPRSN